MSKRKRSSPPGGHQRCKEAEKIHDAVCKKAIEYGFTVNVSRMTTGKWYVTHWMFDDATTGMRVLNWWPSNGTVQRWRRLKEDEPVKDAWEALETAIRVAAEINGWWLDTPCWGLQGTQEGVSV